MKLGVQVTGLAETIRGEIEAGRRAVSISMKTAGQGVKTEWRGEVTSAGLGRRMANTIRSRDFPSDRASVNAAALVWSKAPEIVEAFADGALIRSGGGLHLAIPTEAAGKGPGGRRLTPAEWEQRRGIKLRFVYRKGKPGLLVADAVRLNKRAQAVASRAKTGRGQVTAPIFVLVRQVRLRKRLDLARVVRAWEGRIPQMIVGNWVDGRLGGER